ncbi:hypothetical protein BDN72DRAFT_301190 [Pluteus cervinus]|uniref:Uncharacterized protein n=1 Tax=Pluteus cervinus TaxID=181527 RepID=A0ACD3ACX0_9AGAR|nr:hypothetical protein BDN72DRAFT_301190 [Pluteus cervinus]
MSQIKLVLQPPPNVDFVHGYPGVPPAGADRQQAAVKGAVEVRVGQQPVKAEWVRIELMKVETLPGGGLGNTFYDFVGPSPVNLWTATEDSTLVRNQDFEFNIRIPESIPPTINLEGRAGIKYELIASVCTKGKKGFFRKRKPVVISTRAPIIIDKHDLHSAWPVYCQPETRTISQDGVNLTVDRNQTCYGPGDRISVIATLKSDSLHTVLLRGFELTLKEVTIFRAGAFGAGKKQAPQTNNKIVSESKVAVNATIYGGTNHRAELVCALMPTHTTTTLNAARHIDVTYTISVKALMGTGAHIIMDLPVIISNWPRAVSVEAIRRIGPAPGLSLLAPNTISSAQVQQPIQPAQPIQPTLQNRPSVSTLPTSRPDLAYNQPNVNQYNTLPANGGGLGYTVGTKPTEFGYGTGYNGKPGTAGSITSANGYFVNDPNRAPTVATSPGRRPPSGQGNPNRLTVTNAHPSELSSDEENSRQPNGAPRTWLSATEEKMRFEEARRKVEQVQGPIAGAIISPSSPQPGDQAWPSAAEEKLRFNQAQAAVQRTQGSNSFVPPTTYAPPRSNSLTGSMAGGSSSKPASNAAAIYQQAVSAMTNSPRGNGVPNYPTAEQEKVALRRYEEAKQAVDRTQGYSYTSPPPASSSAPVVASTAPSAAYQPQAAPSSSSSSTPPPANVLPPSFEGISSVISEKERLRRAYEAQDAAALATQRQQQQPQFQPPVQSRTPPPPAAPPIPYSSSPPPFGGGSGGSPSSSSTPLSAQAEKEMLRRKFEAQDTPASPPMNPIAMMGTPGRTSPPQPPPRGSRNTRPVPPSPAGPSVGSGSSGGGSRILTAAEEKAQLRARYEAEESGPSGSSSPQYSATNGIPQYSATNGSPQYSTTNGSPQYSTTNGSPQYSMANGSPQYSTANGSPQYSTTNGTSSILGGGSGFSGSYASPGNGYAGSSSGSGGWSSPPAPPPLMPRPPVEYIQETQEEDERVSKYALHGALPDVDGLPGMSSKMSPASPGVDLRPFTPFSTGFDSLKTPGPPPPLPPKPAE